MLEPGKLGLELLDCRGCEGIIWIELEGLDSLELVVRVKRLH